MGLYVNIHVVHNVHQIMRVDISMSSALRGCVMDYAENRDMTMPQAYSELLQVGLVCSSVDFDDPLPVNDTELERLTDSEIVIEEVTE